MYRVFREIKSVVVTILCNLNSSRESDEAPFMQPA